MSLEAMDDPRLTEVVTNLSKELGFPYESWSILERVQLQTEMLAHLSEHGYFFWLDYVDVSLTLSALGLSGINLFHACFCGLSTGVPSYLVQVLPLIPFGVVQMLF
jgi:hypothetical protein